MAITPEEEEAICNPKLSTKKVTEILRQCRPLPDKRYYDPGTQWVKLEQKPDTWWVKEDDEWWMWKWGIVTDHDFRLKPTSLSDRSSNIRRSLREKFLKWLLDSDRDWSLFWFTDPFLVDEYPVAVQAFAGILEGVCRLGAIVHCKSYTPSAKDVILDIICQLIKKYPPFRRLVLTELADDPMILKKSPHTLFERLIVQPWDVLAYTHPFYLQHPPVIVMVFRQRCTNTDIMGLIFEYSRMHPYPSLLWLFSSHPIYHPLKYLSSSSENGVLLCEYQALSLDDTEAKEDVYRLLHDGFQDIQTRYSGLFLEDEVWPTVDQFAHFTTFISGDYILACTIVRFISADGRNPKQQFDICIMCMTSAPAPSPHDPVVRYRRFVQQLLVEIAPDAIPLLVVNPPATWFNLSIRAVANLLRLSQSEYYRAIEGILCFLVVPSSDDALGGHLGFCDDGFEDFCRWGFQDSWDSTTFSLAPARLSFLNGSLCILGCPHISILLEAMTWSSLTPQNDFLIINRLRNSASHDGLDYNWGQQEEGDHYLRSFDFRCLVGKRIHVLRIYDLVCYLKRKLMFQDFVRTDPLTALDQHFIDKCKMVAIPMNFKDAFSKANMVTEYVLLGDGDQTVLVLFTWILGFAADGRKYIRLDSDVTMYSSDMLEEI